LVREHTDLEDVFTAKTLNESRKNCVEKLISFIRNMEHRGSWLLTQELKDKTDWRNRSTKLGAQSPRAISRKPIFENHRSSG
jgi:hypothetical protein